MDGLRKYVAIKERDRDGFGRIEVHYRDACDSGVPTAKAFVGRWLFSMEEPFILQTYDPSGFPDVTEKYAIALTAKNRIVIVSWGELGDETGSQTFEVYENLVALKSSQKVKSDVTAEIVTKLGVEVKELDI